MSESTTPILDLRVHAAAAPDRVAIACGDERLSYAELEALANRFAAVFRQRGLVRGDHIASLLGNRPEALAIGWAAWRCGLVLTPMSTARTAMHGPCSRMLPWEVLPSRCRVQ
jgi:fatty-acyl-CoA synthase